MNTGRGRAETGLETTTFDAAMRLKYPEWIVMVVTADVDGTPNVMPAGWSMIASHNPPTFAIAINRGHHTHDLIRRSGQFVVAFPGPSLEEAIGYTGSVSGRDEPDKVANAGLTLLPAQEVRPPLLKGCPVNLECELARDVRAGDHSVFLGRVVVCHVNRTAGERLLNFAGRFTVAAPRETSN
jgi:flavin reductase (DIM6/NTAB) family NADH-FMN oxidoreductase RutF